MNMLTWNLENKKVLLRIDGNVPLAKDGRIEDDFRLRAVLPTVDFLINKGAQITVITHLGRPQGHDPELSTRPLQQWFIDQGYTTVVVAENLRFSAGEKTGDQTFAHELAQGMDYYVNDAWGVMHRNDTSITVLPELFPEDRRSFGWLVEKELQALDHLRCNPQTPYVVIVGGGKPETKLPFLKKLKATGRPTTFIVLPALSAEVDAINAYPSGESHVTVVPPVDYTYVLDDFEGALGQCDVQDLPHNGIPLGVGPRSLALYEPLIKNAKTIFINGACGLHWRPETMGSFHAILRMVAQANGYTVAGGGHSVSEIHALGLAEHFDYCSTGGGATLAYISGDELPGLIALGIKKGECR